MDHRSELAVILHADVVGSTALVQQDERIAHERIQNAFQHFSTLIHTYGGTTREIRGDALVAQFERASDAVSAAMAQQEANQGHNAAFQDAIRPELRVGISLGEVVVADDTVTGPGIVLAQRVEQLAPSGGVAVTAAVHEAVPGRLPFRYDDLGAQVVKGFDDPVHVYTVRLRSGEAVPPPEQPRASRPSRRSAPSRGTRIALSATVTGVLTAIALIAWYQPWTQKPGDKPDSAAGTGAPERPSIAVMPFENVSNDSEQEYFADGLTDDLITDLAKVSGLVVVSRNSVFSFKKQAVRVEEVARTLGVRYVVEGTVRRAADRIRVNAQLVNGSTGRHLWAERYDRRTTDIFAVQDELVHEIVAALAVQLSPSEEAKVGVAPTRNLEAYDLYLRARDSYHRSTMGDLRSSLQLFDRVVELDPEFAEAYAAQARLAVDVWRFDYLQVANAVVARNYAEQAATRALELDPNISQAHSVLALLRMVDGQHEFARQLAARGVELSPNSADAHTALAVVLGYGGEPKKALDAMRTAIRLNPRPPVTMQSTYGWVLFLNREYEAAISVLREIASSGHFPAFGDSPPEVLAMAYAQSGRIAEAKVALQPALELTTTVNLAYIRLLYQHHQRQSDIKHRVEALRKAGIPEYGHGFEGDPTFRLGNGALKALIGKGRTWVGMDSARESSSREPTPFIVEHLADGQIMYAGPTTMMSGKVEVRKDELCESYPIVTFGRFACGPVYRNPDGTAEARNQYVYVHPLSPRYFSLQR